MMIFSYNYFSKLTNIDYYYRHKSLFQLNIKVFDSNYQFLYQKVQYICFNSCTWLDINDLDGNYDIINCYAGLIDNKHFVLCGLFNNIYEATIYTNKIVFKSTNLFRIFLTSQQLLHKL